MLNLLEATPVGDGRWAIVVPDLDEPATQVAWGVVGFDGTFDVWGDGVLAESLHEDRDFEDLGHEVRYFEAIEAARKAGVPYMQWPRLGEFATGEMEE